MISNFGRVKKNAYVHYHKDGRVFHYKSIIKKQTVSYGYMEIRLFNEDKLGHIEGRLEKTHRLIANAFIPNPENKPYIDHINTIRHDNRIENLRWCTLSENSNNPITLAKNIESGKKKWIDPIFREMFRKRMNEDDVKNKMRQTSCCKKIEIVKDGIVVGKWFSVNECARQTGIGRMSIIRWCKSNKPNKKGEIWRYAK
jgi:hypothetical protein